MSSVDSGSTVTVHVRGSALFSTPVTDPSVISRALRRVCASSPVELGEHHTDDEGCLCVVVRHVGGDHSRQRLAVVDGAGGARAGDLRVARVAEPEVEVLARVLDVVVGDGDGDFAHHDHVAVRSVRVLHRCRVARAERERPGLRRVVGARARASVLRRVVDGHGLAAGHRRVQRDFEGHLLPRDDACRLLFSCRVRNRQRRQLDQQQLSAPALARALEPEVFAVRAVMLAPPRVEAVADVRRGASGPVGRACEAAHVIEDDRGVARVERLRVPVRGRASRPVSHRAAREHRSEVSGVARPIPADGAPLAVERDLEPPVGPPVRVRASFSEPHRPVLSGRLGVEYLDRDVFDVARELVRTRDAVHDRVFLVVGVGVASGRDGHGLRARSSWLA